MQYNKRGIVAYLKKKQQNYTKYCKLLIFICKFMGSNVKQMFPKKLTEVLNSKQFKEITIYFQIL